MINREATIFMALLLGAVHLGPLWGKRLFNCFTGAVLVGIILPVATLAHIIYIWALSEIYHVDPKIVALGIIAPEIIALFPALIVAGAVRKIYRNWIDPNRTETVPFQPIEWLKSIEHICLMVAWALFFGFILFLVGAFVPIYIVDKFFVYGLPWGFAVWPLIPAGMFLATWGMYRYAKSDLQLFTDFMVMWNSDGDIELA